MGTTMLQKITDRDLEGDVRRALTFPGGYAPTARVLVQRDHHDEVARAHAIGLALRSDCYVDHVMESFWIGFRDNLDAERWDADARELAKQLRAAGFRVRLARNEETGLVRSVKVRFNEAREAEIEAVAPAYLEALAERVARHNP